MTIVSAVAGLNMALPSIARTTGATATELTWIVDAYTVVFASLLFLAGAIGDKYGRKTILEVGLALYAIVAVFGMFVTDPVHLIAVRILMGVGAAAVMPSTLSIITTSFDGEERGKAVSIWVAIAGGGAFIGLFATAILLQYFSWPSFFALNVALAVIGLVATLTVLDNSRDESAPALDWVGGLLTIAGVGAIVYGFIEAPNNGWASPVTVLGIGGGLLALALFLVWEIRQKDPLLDPRLLLNRGFSAGSLSVTLQFFGQFGFIFVAMQYLQFVVGYSPLETAARLLPIPFILAPAARVSGRLADRIPQKFQGSVGLFIFGIAMLMFAGLTTEFSFGYWVVCLVFFGVGAALSVTPATTAITHSLPIEKQGVASAMNDTARELGAALGIAVLSAALNNTYRNGMLSAAARLPDALAEKVTETVAFTQAQKPPQIPQGVWDGLVASARVSFTDGMHNALYIAAGAAFAGAVLVAVIAPRRPEHLQKTKDTRPVSGPA
jgi:MFS family permease